MNNAAPLVFGFRTATLLILAVQGYILAALLLGGKHNKSANRALAALLAAMALSLTPDIIGFAGFYDRWPWLSFAPFELGLVIGPLYYLYVASLTRGSAPHRWRAHFIPAALELMYLTACFALPLDTKLGWAERIHEPYVAPFLNVVQLLSMTVYLVLAWRQYRTYQRWLANHVSFGADFRMPWIAVFLGAVALVLGVTLAFNLTEYLITPLGYFRWFWAHLALAVISYFLGLAGWRAGDREYPVMTDGARDVATQLKSADGAIAEQGRDFERRVREREWWRDTQLTLGRLAERLEVSEGQLSRALNQGLGLNFNEFVNGMRVEAVTRAITDPRESRSVLRIALDCGFSSKASFNRAFKAATGSTPTEMRRRAGIRDVPISRDEGN